MGPRQGHLVSARGRNSCGFFQNKSAGSTTRQTPPGQTPYLLIEYRQRAGGTGTLGTDYRADGLRYRVETSTDLVTWTLWSELAGASAHLSRLSNGDGTETVTMNLFVGPALEDERRVFTRLHISAAPWAAASVSTLDRRRAEKKGEGAEKKHGERRSSRRAGPHGPDAS